MRGGQAEETGLSSECADVVYGEAMLTMQRTTHKKAIMEEAHRLLRPGGRYGIHELCLVPDDIDPRLNSEIAQALSETIHVGARPLTVSAWTSMLEEAGVVAEVTTTAPMHLLRLSRLIEDEGLKGTARIVWNMLRDGVARRRVLAMRRVFQRYEAHLGAVAIVAKKPT